jgi:hypothetical protein
MAFDAACTRSARDRAPRPIGRLKPRHRTKLGNLGFTPDLPKLAKSSAMKAIDRLRHRWIEVGMVDLPRQVDRQLQQSSNHYCVARCASARRVIAIMPSVSHPAHSLCRLDCLWSPTTYRDGFWSCFDNAYSFLRHIEPCAWRASVMRLQFCQEGASIEINATDINP